MKIKRIFTCTNPVCKVADLRAFMDTYAFRFSVKGKTYVECPIWMFAMATDVGISPRYSERLRTPVPKLSLTIDDPDTVKSTLFFQGPPREDEVRKPRWPFWVESTLQLQFLFERDDDELAPVTAQEFLFEPGKRYETETAQGLMFLP